MANFSMTRQSRKMLGDRPLGCKFMTNLLALEFRPVNERMKKQMKGTLVLLSFALMTACQSASSESTSAIAVGALIEQYERSSLSVRSAFDGKEITVRGYTTSPAVMPGDKDQGSVMLHDESVQLGRAVTCWFSRGQITEFSKIKGSQFVTVKGVFAGERGAELKFCKLVRIE